MKRRRNQKIPKDVEKLLEQIEVWRRTKPKPRAMPGHLWDEAVSLAVKHGPYTVAKHLNLNCTKLKRLVTRKSSTEQVFALVPHPSPEPAEFVSLPAQAWFGDSQQPPAVLELYSAEGHSMTLRTHQPFDLVELFEAFWSRPR